mmetsp:Transcript_28158/g.67275  ORF Transcript_28158/g.67275 Transcript_28158/m.67275 type:complete len:302 (+) Transcript_28158:1138-2043(+)
MSAAFRFSTSTSAANWRSRWSLSTRHCANFSSTSCSFWVRMMTSSAACTIVICICSRASLRFRWRTPESFFCSLCRRMMFCRSLITWVSRRLRRVSRAFASCGNSLPAPFFASSCTCTRASRNAERTGSRSVSGGTSSHAFPSLREEIESARPSSSPRGSPSLPWTLPAPRAPTAGGGSEPALRVRSRSAFSYPKASSFSACVYPPSTTPAGGAFPRNWVCAVGCITRSESRCGAEERSSGVEMRGSRSPSSCSRVEEWRSCVRSVSAPEGRARAGGFFPDFLSPNMIIVKLPQPPNSRRM